MPGERMQPERFAAILETYGADPGRWPADDRRAALEFLMSSREARRLRDEAAALDALLDRASPVEVSTELRDRIVGRAPARTSAREMRMVIGALAASLLLGFVTGITLQVPPAGADDIDFLQLAHLGDTYPNPDF